MEKKYYDELTDEAIIGLIRHEDRIAMDYLIGKYKNLVRKKAKALFLIGGDREDLIQEGMIGLYKAIRDYQPDKAATFSTFADLCVSRQMYSAIKTSNTMKNQPLNNYISIDSHGYGEDKENTDSITYVAHLAHARNMNPEEMLIDRENAQRIESKLMNRLSEFEKDILTLYLKDYNYSEIAKFMNKEPKAIDNGLQRIKKKLNETLAEET
ncbi:MAG: RNA polymerase sporulation sigma factor SigH [Clostridiales bacterium]|nr:RNA polymerase sporulation sigma factor SigH [Clostridiales bacterium]